MVRRIPRLCRHRASGRAYVTDPATGREVYLGWYGTEEADAAYDRWVTEYLSRPAGVPSRPTGDTTVGQLIDAYLTFAESYYRKNGKPTSEVGTIRQAIAFVRDQYAAIPARTFGPRQLKSVRQAMIESDLARGHINKQIGRIRRVWRWAVEHEMVPSTVLESLRSVAPISIGRTPAKEEEPVEPVDLEVVNRTLPILIATVADMVRVQLLTGMRPGEVCIMSPADLDRSSTPWLYTPSQHKGEHIERNRQVWIGPQARAILDQRIAGLAPDDWIFPTIRRRAGESGRYATSSYRKRVQRAIDRANLSLLCDRCKVEKRSVDDACSSCRSSFLPRWFPLQLRHTAGTAIRKKYGLEASQVVLGHAEADVTQIYAERDNDLARRVAEDVG